MAKKTTPKGGWGRPVDVIKYDKLETEIARLTKVLERDSKHRDRRKLFYFRHIKKWFDKRGLEPEERDRVLEAGWTKVREYASLLSRDEGSRKHFEKWTIMATTPRVTVEQVKQAAERGWPRVPAEDERVESFTLQLVPEVKQQLADALQLRGRRPYQKGKRGGRQDSWQEYGDSKAVMRLLKDAARGQR